MWINFIIVANPGDRKATLYVSREDGRVEAVDCDVNCYMEICFPGKDWKVVNSTSTSTQLGGTCIHQVVEVDA
jgi:hypothetical protein